MSDLNYSWGLGNSLAFIEDISFRLHTAINVENVVSIVYPSFVKVIFKNASKKEI